MATNGKPGQTVTQALVQVRNAGTSQSISNFVHSNPELAAQVTKLLQPKTPKTFDGKGRQEVTAPRVDSVLQISQRISQKSTDAKAVMQLFPDVRLAAEILVVSTISPNDMFNQEIVVTVPDNLYCGPLATTLQPLIKDYIEAKSNIEILIRERGKLVGRRDTHNIFPTIGGVWLAQLICGETTNYINQMGLGIGGSKQNNSNKHFFKTQH